MGVLMATPLVVGSLNSNDNVLEVMRLHAKAVGVRKATPSAGPCIG